MRRASWLLLGIGVALAIPAGRAAAADPPASAATGATLTTLGNGLRLVLAPDPRAHSVDITVWYDVGASQDRSGKTGLAHLFEHLMFRGSTHFGQGEHARRVRAEGGSSGAVSTHDFTAFYQTLPGDAVELAFRLEADRMSGLQITQEGLDLERAQVAGERARRATPTTVGLDLLYSRAWEGHPYARSLYGLDADLARLTLQDCRDFLRTRFGPDRALITVVGNFDPEAVRALAKRHFESLKPTKVRPAALGTPRAQTSERRASGRSPSAVRVMMAGWRVPPRGHADWPVYSVLATLLARASDAPLARTLIVDRPLCTSVNADVDSRREGSMFYLAAVVNPEADSTEVEEQAFKEVGRLLVEPVKPADLERARRQAELGLWLGLQTPRDRAHAMGTSAMLAGDPNDLGRLAARLREVSAADIQRVSTQLEPALRTVVWLSPAPTASGPRGGQP